MRLSFSTNAFIRYSLEECLPRIARIGYQGVEILADVPHLYAYTVKSERVKEIKKELVRLNLTVANLNANTALGYYSNPPPEQLFGPSLADKDEHLRKWRIEYTKRCLDLAVELNCQTVSVTSGRPQAGFFPEQAFQKLIASLEEVVVYAESSNVLLGMEYEPGLLIESSEELKDILCFIKKPNLGVNLDLGHAWVQGEDPIEVIDLFGKAIFHIHLEDIKGRKHYHLIPGEGDLDFKKIVDKLKETDYNRFLSLELYTYPDCPEEAALKAYGYLSSFFHPGGLS